MNRKQTWKWIHFLWLALFQVNKKIWINSESILKRNHFRVCTNRMWSGAKVKPSLESLLGVCPGGGVCLVRGLPRGYVCQRLPTQGVSAICQGHLPLDRDPPLDRDLPEQRSPPLRQRWIWGICCARLWTDWRMWVKTLPCPKLRLLMVKTEKDGDSLNGFNLRVFSPLTLRFYPFTQMYHDSHERGISGQFETISWQWRELWQCSTGGCDLHPLTLRHSNFFYVDRPLLIV